MPSSVLHTGNGATTDYVVAFPYLSKDFVRVEVGAASAAFSWVNDSTIRILPAPPLGLSVRVYRETPSAPLVTLNNTNPNPASSYNKLTTQAIHISEENREISQLEYLVERAEDATVDALEALASVTAATLTVPLSMPSAGALFSNTSIGYAIPAATLVTPGQVIKTLEDEFSFQVAPSASVDHQVTVNGVKIYVLPNRFGKISPKQFNAPIDGINDDSPALFACISMMLAKGLTVDLGSATYMHGSLGLTRTPLLFDVLNGQSPRITSNGATIRDQEGLTPAIGRFNRTLSFNVPDGVTAGDLLLEGFTVDKRGSTVASGTDYEQAHAIAIYTTGSTSKYRSITCRDVFTKDKVGGGIVLAAGASDDVLIDNCHGTDWGYTGAERGDLEFQMTIKNGLVTGSSGRFTQLEPNVTTPLAGIANPFLKYSGCFYNVFDMIGFSAAKEAQRFALVDCHNGPTGDFWFRNAVADVSGGKLRTTGVTDWRNSIIRWRGGEVVVGVNTTTNTFQSLAIGATALTKMHASFYGTAFSADATADAATTGFAIVNPAAVLTADVSKLLIRCFDCAFSPAFQKTANCYRNGTWEFIRSRLASRAGSAALEVGGDASYAGALTVDTCDLTDVSGTTIGVTSAGASGWSLTLRGEMDYAKFSLSGRPTTEYQDTKVRHEAIWMTDAAPAGPGLNGQRVRIRKPANGIADTFVVTVGSTTSATFRSISQAGVKKDITSNLPVPSAGDIGVLALDTTLNASGQPVIWTGSAWQRLGVPVFTGSAAYDPPSVATESEVTTTVAVTGAAMGDIARASFSIDSALKVSARVSSAGTVTVTLRNDTVAAIDLASGTLRVLVEDLT